VNHRTDHPPIARSELPDDTAALARFLIGKLVMRALPEGMVSGRIVETEAYVVGDAAGHGFRGMTPRNRSLFLERGHAYVYLAYGVSMMLNVSSEAEGTGTGVLIRALEPLEGIAIMRENRGVERLRPGARAGQAGGGAADRPVARRARPLPERASMAGEGWPKTRRDRARHQDRHYQGCGPAAAVLCQGKPVRQRAEVASGIRDQPAFAARRA